MSRPLVALPATAAKPVADRFQIKDSPDGLESFDLLAHGSAVADALRCALARPAAVGALVLTAAAPPADAALLERFAALKIPTLVLLGTRDAEMPPETPRRWRALLPSCNVVLVYDAAHALAADRPQAFADLLTDFLSDPAAFLVNRRSGALQP
jgi:pimeloyl-ACP methyl ester carboxylesterase